MVLGEGREGSEITRKKKPPFLADKPVWKKENRVSI